MLRDWEGENVIWHRDGPSGAWIVIAVHSTRLGPAVGGTYLGSYPSLGRALQHALLGAADLTYKFAAADFPRGGGQAVLCLPQDLDGAERAGLLHRYGQLLHKLEGYFQTGPSSGTTTQELQVIAETGAPWVINRPPGTSSAGNPGAQTALGVFCAIKATCEQVFGTPDLSGRRVLVQGSGPIGGPLIERLRIADARVLFADSDPPAVSLYRDALGLTHVPDDQVYTTACDIFAPCAESGILNAETIPQLNCRAVVGGADHQLATTADAARLHARGIVYAPDYVVNSGGVLASIGQAALGWLEGDTIGQVCGVSVTLRLIFAHAAAEGVSPEVVARRMVAQRLAAAPAE